MLRYSEEHRTEGPEGGPGVFKMDSVLIIASDGLGWEELLAWEHVSVSKRDSVPTWQEMCMVKELFFGPDDWVMQLHPPKNKNINLFEHCLHLWRPIHAKIPVPPSILV